MYNKHAKVAGTALATMSLPQLAEFAIEEELIDRFDSSITIWQGDERFDLPHRQASTFLIGMLRGRSWYVGDPAATEEAPISSEEEEAGQGVFKGHSLDSALAALLTFSREIGIIREYRLEPAARMVQIDIAACSSPFSYSDAVDYLLDCAQHEFRASISVQ